MQKLVEAFMRFFFKHLYTTLARAYDFVAWTTSMGQWRNWQSEALIEFPPGILLEIGHGPGHLLLDIKRLGSNEIFGVDPSRQMTRLASERFRKVGEPNVSIRAKAQSLPFPSGSFSGVIATFPSEYILDSKTLEAVIRVLQSGGKFVLIGLGSITGRAFYDRFAGWLYRTTGQSGYAESAYEPWLKELERLGFEAHIESIDQPRARVVRILAGKP